MPGCNARLDNHVAEDLSKISRSFHVQWTCKSLQVASSKRERYVGQACASDWCVHVCLIFGSKIDSWWTTGSLLFCPDCGTLLNFPEDGKPDIPCEQCGHLEPASCKQFQCIPKVLTFIFCCSVREHRDHNAVASRRVPLCVASKAEDADEGTCGRRCSAEGPSSLYCASYLISHHIRR